VTENFILGLCKRQDDGSAATLVHAFVTSITNVLLYYIRPESHLGLHSRLDLSPKRLESRLSHHLMTHSNS